MVLEFTVPGTPIGKGRPRFRRIGKYVQTYTPKKTRDYEELIRKEFRKQCKTNGKLLSGAIKAEICGVFPIPKSTSKANKALMISDEIPYTKKIDVDNLIKSVLDSLNKVAFDDDSAVNEVYAIKIYGEEPRCEVRLSDDKHTLCPIFFTGEENNE